MMDDYWRTALPLLPLLMRICTWNVRGLNVLKQNDLEAYELLSDFDKLGPYDILMLQEHKLLEEDIDFVGMRLGNPRSCWAQRKAITAVVSPFWWESAMKTM